VAAPVSIVAAENFYGDVAKQIGGPEIAVHSIISNPDTDPHLFEASPSVARALAGARIVIDNGIGYDPWMARLLRAAGGHDRTTITVAALIRKKPGDNPHIWYDPHTMPALARVLAQHLAQIDPAHRAAYQARLARFLASMRLIDARIASLHARLAGTPVTATEPVFGYMLAALGMTVRNAGFQLAVMNNTEPSAAEIAAFENDLKNRRAKLLVYNGQASDPAAARMLALAKEAHIPVVAVTETEPAGETYQSWVRRELDAVDRALPK
jgi:zinc/manganese transport system substrate-binding protein